METTRKNACNRETMRMMKIGAVTMFMIAQAALAKQHASRRSANMAVEDQPVRCNCNMAVEDRAIRCNRNTVTSGLSNNFLPELADVDLRLGVLVTDRSATTTSAWRNERTGTTRKNACNRQTMRMTKIRVVIIFIIAQVALAKWHASRRSMNTAVEDRAIRCNRNTVTK